MIRQTNGARGENSVDGTTGVFGGRDRKNEDQRDERAEF